MNNDLRISFRETGTAVHMIFRHGSRPLVLSQESRDIVGQSANRQRNSLRMLLLLLLVATRITNL